MFILTKTHIKKVTLKSFGCKLNSSESLNIERQIEDHNLQLSLNDEKADVHLINTCAVNEKAIIEFENYIHKVKKYNPNTKIIAFGCFAENDPNKVTEFEEVDLVLQNIRNKDIYSYINKVNYFKNKISDLEVDADKVVSNNLFSSKINQQSKLKNECDYYCSYCKFSVCQENNKLKTDSKILISAQKIADAGVIELVLSNLDGDTISSSGEKGIIELLKKLENIDGFKRIRLSKIEPTLLTDELIDFIAQSEKVLPYFHINIRSGSRRMLKSMNVNYKREQVAKIIETIHEKISDAKIGLDIFTYNNNESNWDFKRSLKFLNNINFAFLQLIPFDNKEEIKEKNKIQFSERMKILKNLHHNNKITFQRQNLNTLKSVLFSPKQNDGYILGLTNNYLRVKAKYLPELKNSLCNAKLISVDSDDIIICEPALHGNCK